MSIFFEILLFALIFKVISFILCLLFFAFVVAIFLKLLS